MRGAYAEAYAEPTRKSDVKTQNDAFKKVSLRGAYAEPKRAYAQRRF